MILFPVGLISLLLAHNISSSFDSFSLSLIRILWGVFSGVGWLLNWLGLSLLWWLFTELDIESAKWSSPLLFRVVWWSSSHQVVISSLSNLELEGVSLSSCLIISSLDFGGLGLLESLLGGYGLGSLGNALFENLSSVVWVRLRDEVSLDGLSSEKSNNYEVEFHFCLVDYYYNLH